MYPSTSIFTAMTLLISLTTSQSTSTEISPSQSSAISSALSSYEVSLLLGPIATSLIGELASDVPMTEASSFATSLASHILTLVPYPTTDQYSYATAPPVSDLSTLDWANSLPADVRTDLEGLRTSLILGEASVVRSVLSITETPSVVSEISSSASASAASSSESAASPSSTETSTAHFLLGPTVLLSAFTSLLLTVVVIGL